MRIAFAGQRQYFGYTALQAPAGGWEPRFVHTGPDTTPAQLREALAAFDPDVVVCFRPEHVPAGALDGLRAVTIGYLTEPLPRPDTPGHADLAQRLEYLRAADAGQFDRICSFDPHIAQTAGAVVDVWRSFPIPVGDHHFHDVSEARGAPQILFTGRSTPHRDSYLGPVKHHFDVVHLAHGVTDERLTPFLEDADIGLNLHNEPYPNYENRVSVYLAAGLLVISEELSPRWGLAPGVDYVEVADRHQLHDVLLAASRTPAAFHALRLSGRRKAERFRASRVWPALAQEALADVAALGSERRRSDAPATVADA